MRSTGALLFLAAGCTGCTGVLDMIEVRNGGNFRIGTDND